MRYSNESSFRRQFNFLRRQFLQDGELPFTDVLSRETVFEALAGSMRRANGNAIGNSMCDDSRHGIAATVVFAEHLTQKAPDGCDRAEDSVPILDAMFVENVADTVLGQNVREREPLVTRKAGAHRIQA